MTQVRPDRVVAQILKWLRVPRYQMLLVVLGLAGLTLAIRLPSMGNRLGRDEATFVLVGQSLLDGHLPYTVLWDNKPPLIFAFMAAVIGLFGKSLWAIRFAGALCLLGASYFTFRSAERLWNRATGFLAGCLVIVYVTTAPSGSIVMSELVALPGLMWATSLLLKLDNRPRDLFLAGLGVSLASLVRMNLAYVAVAGGLFLAIYSIKKVGFSAAMRPLAAYAGGGLLPLVLVALPYMVSGELGTFIDSVFKAPLSYVSARTPMVKAAVKIFGYGLEAKNLPLLLGMVSALGLFCRQNPKSDLRLTPDQRWRLAGIFILGAATVYSIAGSGGGFAHYAIQAIPFFALPAARFYVALWAGRPRLVQALGWVLVFCALYYSTDKIWSKYSFGAGKSREEKIAEFIAERNPEGRPVYLMSSHGAHWYLGSAPITKVVTHPTNITKVDLFPFMTEPGATPNSELRKIFSQEPIFVVVGSKTNLKSHPSTERLFQETIRRHYRKVKQISGETIYMRRDGKDMQRDGKDMQRDGKRKSKRR